MNNQLIIESTQDSCRTITLNRPEVLNAFSVELSEAFCQAVARAAQDEAVKVVVLKGAGRAFCAGGDLKLLQQNLPVSNRIFKQISAHLHEAIEQITTMPKAVIAAVKGPAYAAGFGVALSCDIVVATHPSSFCPSFINMGISPNAAVTFFLPRILGKNRAAETLFRGRAFTAPEALDAGLINHVWAEESFEKELQNLIDDLAGRCTPTIGRIKKLLNESYGKSLHEHLGLEREEIAAASLEESFKERVTDFVERHRKAHEAS